jgi:Protein of unknown function (DUF4242)
MPQYRDFHPDLKLPHEAIDGIAAGAKDGTADQFRVTQVELYHNDDGKVYCLRDAPDAQAVRDHHAAIGVPCGDVHEVKRDPLSRLTSARRDLPVMRTVERHR